MQTRGWLFVTGVIFTSCASPTRPTPVKSVEPPAVNEAASFSISCSKQAQTHFAEAMNAIHQFRSAAAADGFARTLAADPECAMGHWGIALASSHPIRARGMTETAFLKGRAALLRAKELPRKKPAETDYIRVLSSLFEGAESRTFAFRLEIYEAKLSELHESRPDDATVAGLLAVARLASAGAVPASDQRIVETRRMLERTRARAPSESDAIDGYLAYLESLFPGHGQAAGEAPSQAQSIR